MDINKVKLLFMKNSPEIMIGLGIAGAIVATVMACKATLHVEEELEYIENNVEEIKSVPEEEGINTKKELTFAYIRGAGRIVKLYAPSVAMGAISVGSILYGHNILQKRTLGIAAAYNLMDQSYKTYRDRVKEKFGEEVEKEIRYGLGREDIDYIEETKEGKEKKRTRKGAATGGDTLASPYARKFDEACINWKRSPERNLYFLRMMQAEANDALQARGHLFLNEVYDMLGFPRTKDGQLVGWIRGGEDVDFGIYTVFKKENNDFVNGYVPTAIIDFNVDGLIYDKI
jgi:hypothetical protein